MIDINKYIGIPYDDENYTCWHMAKQVLKECFDVELPTAPDVNDIKPLGVKLDKPENGCLILMYDAISKQPSHVGIYVNDSVLHCHKPFGSVVSSYWRTCERIFWKIECYAINNCT